MQAYFSSKVADSSRNDCASFPAPSYLKRPSLQCCFMRKNRRPNILLRHDDRPIERCAAPALFLGTILTDQNEHRSVDSDFSCDFAFALGSIGGVRIGDWVPLG